MRSRASSERSEGSGSMGREILRFAQDDRAGAKGLAGAPMVTPERSEGSGSMGREILRFAQDDRAGAKGLAGAPMVTPPRSEGSGSRAREILRFVQDDRAVLPAALWPTRAHVRLRLMRIRADKSAPTAVSSSFMISRIFCESS